MVTKRGGKCFARKLVRDVSVTIDEDGVTTLPNLNSEQCSIEAFQQNAEYFVLENDPTDTATFNFEKRKICLIYKTPVASGSTPNLQKVAPVQSAAPAVHPTPVRPAPNTTTHQPPQIPHQASKTETLQKAV